ncbi:MAG TPA: hypothetical protein VN457_01490, partial [Chlamydiales bacterium]|nr:hypothetical protein [Chlamydiales bacterium]
MYNLLWFILIPFIAALLAFVLPTSSQKRLKQFAFLSSLLPLCILSWYNTALIGEDLNFSWMRSLSIQFHLHIDSLSFIFLFLANVIVPISILAQRSEPLNAPRFFYGLI